MPLLLLQVALAPLLIAGGTLAQRRWGQRIGGLLIGLPLTSLPLLLLVTLAHGAGFAGRAATASLEGTAAQAALVWVYAVTARRAGPAASLAASLGVFAALVGVLDLLPAWPALLGAGAGIVAYGLALRYWPGPAPNPVENEVAPQAAGARIGLRMGLAASFALAVSAGSGTLGAHLSGLVTALPLLTVVMGLLTHREDGGRSVVAFLHGVTRGSFSVVTALTVLALTLPTGHVALAFAAAVGVALATQAVCGLVGREEAGATAPADVAAR